MDGLTPERRSANMRRIQSKHTSPELSVRRMIHQMGFRYRLHRPDLPGKPDLVFERLMSIVEVRGCFWHQHVGCVDSHIPKSRVEYWEPKLQKNKARDEANQIKLRKLGWRVLVVWECQTHAHDKLSKRLKSFLENGSGL